MSNFPEIEAVDTPLGPCERVWATSETHIGMTGRFIVNRVEISVRLDLNYRDGEWQRGDKDDFSSKWHALMVRRVDDFRNGRYNADVSSAARAKIEAALVPWLIEYATGDGAEMVRQAGCQDRTQKIESKRETIEKMRAEIAQAETELAELEDVSRPL